MSKKIANWEEAFGWYGAAAILFAYAAVSFGWLNGQSVLFQLLNGTGAAGITYISAKKHAWQPATLNAIWMVIAVIVLLQILL